MDQFKCVPRMVTIDFFSAGSLWNLEFCRSKYGRYFQKLPLFHRKIRNEIRSKGYKKNWKNRVANFGFNSKNGNFSPIIRLHAMTRNDRWKVSMVKFALHEYCSWNHAKQGRKHFLSFLNKWLKHFKITVTNSYISNLVYRWR